ncbi:uncharacterized protein LOC135200698 [Macrobrachium nipponense]|uniref:uncharacterized protein LOC135200698 n=1 Tax=Macrobrachium nipponense TaxID=159736 RepID=UPI0030C7A8BA
MRVKICYEREPINIINAYAPQVGRTEKEKSSFWNDMNEVTQELEEQERIVVGADFNGHVGNKNDIIEHVHGGQGIGERSPEGGSTVDFTMSFDMAIVNTFFKKKREHLITYMSGGRCTQIDYLLYNRSTGGS